MLNKLASRPRFSGECASELDTRVNPSNDDTRQFMAGSEESPVSTAKIWGVKSSKHSSMESKPDLEPSTENQGVQMWAGIKKASLEVSSRVSSRSRASSPRIGRPSDFILPILSSRLLNCRATSKSGAKTRL